MAGSARRSSSIRACTFSFRAGLSGPRFEPLEEAALYGAGVVAEGRAQKYPGFVKGWPISDEPTGLPFRRIRLPFAWDGKAT